MYNPSNINLNNSTVFAEGYDYVFDEPVHIRDPF